MLLYRTTRQLDVSHGGRGAAAIFMLSPWAARAEREIKNARAGGVPRIVDRPLLISNPLIDPL